MITSGIDTEYIAGFCGYNYEGSITNCFFLDMAGPDNGLGEPLDDPNMRIQGNFVDWDFDPGDGDPADWFMPIDDYPKLSWEQTIAFTGQTNISLAKGDSDSIQLEVYSQIDETLNWTITGYESYSWISSLSPDSGVSTGPTDLTTVTINIDTATLTYGTYYCELILAADNDASVIFYLRLYVTLGGYGTQIDPFRIEDFTDFQVFVDSTYAEIYWSNDVYTRLDCDLDLDPNMAGRQIYTTAVVAPDTDNSNNDFQGTAFDGIFDGNGHIISNLTIDTAGVGNDFLGLFGQINDTNSEVKNLGLGNVIIIGGNNSIYFGGLCGYNYNGIISNCYTTGSIHCEGNSRDFGSLCGFNHSGIIDNCYSTGSVAGGDNSSNIGGLCGVNGYGSISNCITACSVTCGINSSYFGGLCGWNSSSIDNCYSTDTVTGGEDSDCIGGLCGYNNSGSISNCYSTGLVSGSIESDYLGGLCGYNKRGNIDNCYAIGTVISGTGSDYIGGLCGLNYDGNINKCYANGSVTGDNLLGGLCGYNDGSTSNCYFLNTAGPDNGAGQPLDDPNMMVQASFVGWDFVGDDNGNEDHWQMCIDGYDYPRLRWEFVNPADFLYPGRVDNYDLFVFTHDWLTTDSRCCNIAPADNPNDIVNLLDCAEFTKYWLEE
jgi:hypothetical protein